MNDFGSAVFRFWIVFLDKPEHRLDTFKRWIRRHVVVFCRQEIDGFLEDSRSCFGAYPELFLDDVYALFPVLFDVRDTFEITLQKSYCAIAIIFNVTSRRRHHRLKIIDIEVPQVHKRAEAAIFCNEDRRTGQHGSFHPAFFQACRPYMEKK